MERSDLYWISKKCFLNFQPARTFLENFLTNMRFITTIRLPSTHRSYRFSVKCDPLSAHDRQFGHFINGKWHKPEGRDYYTSKSPMNKQVLTDTIQGKAEDVDFAVQSAKEAQVKWAALSPHVRARHLYAIARAVQVKKISVQTI